MASTPTENRRGPDQGLQLLVSVRNRHEALLAQRAGVDWIDLKAPEYGPLGRPDLLVAQQVGHALADFPCRSAALGELADLQPDDAFGIAAWFPTLKVGLSHQDQHAWETRLDQLRNQLPDNRFVPVVYADWQSCRAPAPASVMSYAIASNSDWLLWDTYAKDGRTLFDFTSENELATMIEQAAQAGIRCVLAGSLRQDALASIRRLRANAIGIRGAVCEARREGPLCPVRLDSWVDLLAST